MTSKPLPFTEEQIRQAVELYPTPFHIYNEALIRQTARDLLCAFAWAPKFREYYAVKALPNPHIIAALHEEGLGADCSSMAELLLCERLGIKGDQVIFTSNDTPAEEFIKARDMHAIVNLDDIGHIEFLERTAGLPDLVCLRFNPGPERVGNSIIGNPVEAKFGMTRDQLRAAYSILKSKGVKRFGLHAMIASNELTPAYFVDTARMLFSLVAELSRDLEITFEIVNLGGGFGIPYRPGDMPLDLDAISNGVRAEYNTWIVARDLPHVTLALECGRFLTGPAGCLVSRVQHVKESYKHYAGLDACMAHLMRPGMYGAYHHITILGKSHLPHDHEYDVTGSLCENNDKFAVSRALPALTTQDIVVIHDTGAHGHSMGFNYNGKLRSAELLLTVSGTWQCIRRAETYADYFATITEWPQEK
jgi:diaminopimelate decarboxylase